MTDAAVPRQVRICVIGNSHVGALRRGWDALKAERDDVQPVFFASPGRSLAGLQRQGTRLVPALPGVARYLALTSGGLSEIELGEFDAFVLVGMAFLMPRPDRRHTLAVIRATCEDAWTTSISASLVALIRASSGVPLLVAHNPLPSARQPNAHLRPLGYAETMDVMQNDVMPPAVQLLPQVAETRADDWLTRPEFLAGATTLLGEGLEDDNATHMNARFGELQWRALLGRLQLQPGQCEEVLPMSGAL